MERRGPLQFRSARMGGFVRIGESDEGIILEDNVGMLGIRGIGLFDDAAWETFRAELSCETNGGNNVTDLGDEIKGCGVRILRSESLDRGAHIYSRH
jgi:hypothetical protein